MHNTKVIYISGAARRLGAGLVRYFHEKHYSIILHYRRAKVEAETLANSLNQIRPNSVYLQTADFNDSVDYSKLMAEAAKVWGRLDALINNASAFYPTTLGEITEAQWYDLFASNAKAPLFLSQAAWPYLKQHHGSIINIIDIHAKKPLKNYLVYSMAKASLASMTQGLAFEMAPEVRVNGIAPGAFLWPEGVNQLSNATQKKILEKTPLKKQGDITDIAQAADYFLQAKFVTGQILEVSGGR